MGLWNPANAILQITSALLSFIASTATVVTILRSPGGLQTPYRRIIVGISLTDALQSCALWSGPMAVPSTFKAFYPWASGNSFTCGLNGTFALGCGIAVPLYTLLLCVYYLCKMKYSMTNDEFEHRIERKTHTCVSLFVITSCMAALCTKSINPIPGGQVCHVSAFPPGCKLFPDIVGPCSRGLHAFIFVYIYLCGLPLMVFPSIGICMAMLVYHAYVKGKVFKAISTRATDSEPITSTSSVDLVHTIPCSNGEGNDQQQTNETRNNYLGRIYRRETIIQASLYVTAFFGVYFLSFFVAMVNVSKALRLKPEPFQTAISILFPSGGLFNILIFSRPKVALLRRNHSRFSWLQGQWIVFRYGLEIPSEASLLNIPPWFSQWKCCGKKQEVLDLASNDIGPSFPLGKVEFLPENKKQNGPDPAGSGKTPEFSDTSPKDGEIYSLDSLNAVNGVSESFNRSTTKSCCNVAYRSKDEWHHVVGKADETLVVPRSHEMRMESDHDDA